MVLSINVSHLLPGLKVNGENTKLTRKLEEGPIYDALDLMFMQVIAYKNTHYRYNGR